MRKQPEAPTCYQVMENPDGSINGGDRCTEAQNAIVDALFKGSPEARKGMSTHDLMLEFTRLRNHGSIVSSDQPPTMISDWAQSVGITVRVVPRPTEEQIRACVDARHYGVLNVADYGQLKTDDGVDPYPFTEPTRPEGHVIGLVGYDDERASYIINDTLRAQSPADYSVASITAASCDLLMEFWKDDLLLKPVTGCRPRLWPW